MTQTIASHDWQFDEFCHGAVDFSDPAQVAIYDRRQGSSIEEELCLARELGIAPGMRVVEYGPGTGTLALAVAGMGAEVIAVDTSRAMLRCIERRASERGLKIQCVHAGFLTYEHCAEPADWILSKFALHHLPDFWKAIALMRMAKVLRSGGRMYLRDVIFTFRAEDADSHIERWISDFVRKGSFTREQFTGHVRDEYSTFAWVLEGLIQRAGFHIDRTDYPTPAFGSLLCTRVMRAAPVSA